MKPDFINKRFNLSDDCPYYKHGVYDCKFNLRLVDGTICAKDLVFQGESYVKI